LYALIITTKTIFGWFGSECSGSYFEKAKDALLLWAMTRFAPRRFGAEPAGETFTTKFSLKYETLPVANELLTAV
jgi:hypothetical protein